MTEAGQSGKWAVERAHPRYPFEGALTIVTPEPNRLTLRGRIVDLSEGGISARLPADLGVGEIVQMEFILPAEREPMRIRCIVRSRLITRYGFEFLLPNPDQLTRLHRLCQTLKMLG
jgi:hypothetical protein